VISRVDGLSAAIAETSRLMALGAAGPQVVYQPALQSGDLTFIAEIRRRADEEFELTEAARAIALSRGVWS
jgi:hypothetical protein